jgi:hypothetical protein
MKHDVLRSIAHNLAASLASGIGLLIGVYELNVFGDARRSPGGLITIDFLHGVVADGRPSRQLADAVRRYRDALPGLCKRHGASVADFAELTVQYSATPIASRFLITVTDQNGRQSSAEYDGFDGQRVKMIDGEGRLRPKPVRRSGSRQSVV